MTYYYPFFFFKQKPAYEMRISDWSSDVCSSDLLVGNGAAVQFGDAAGDRDQGEEGKDSRLDRERAERHLLGAEEAAERNHDAIEDGEKQQRGRDGARGRASHRRPIVAFVVRGKMARRLTLAPSPQDRKSTRLYSH